MLVEIIDTQREGDYRSYKMRVVRGWSATYEFTLYAWVKKQIVFDNDFNFIHMKYSGSKFERTRSLKRKYRTPLQVKIKGRQYHL